MCAGYFATAQASVSHPRESALHLCSRSIGPCSAMPTLGMVFKSLLLVVNACAILHEDRFLRKVGFSEEGAALDGQGMKMQIVNLLKAFRLLRRKIAHRCASRPWEAAQWVATCV